MTSKELRTLNAYPEWKSNDDIENVRNFVLSIQNNQPLNIPEELNNRQKRRFYEKFINNYFVDDNGKLFYQPITANGEPRIRLEVVSPDLHQRKLQEIYNDDKEGLGIGLNLFYYQVCSQYLGIKRDECREFLKKQGNYTLARNYQKVINKPILAKSPNERWGSDIMDLLQYGLIPNLRNGQPNPMNIDIYNQNGRMKYVFVVVDFFSKKVWARPLQNKSGSTIRNVLQDICQSSQTYPRILQTDNGGEYANPTFERFCEENNINHIKTTPYNPISNGLAERMIKEIRKKIRNGFIKHNNLEWVNYLQDYVDNINNQRHGRTK